MATLTAPERDTLRQYVARQVGTVAYTKTQVNAALQALENDKTTFVNRCNTVIEGAAPGVFSAAQKRILAAAVILHWLDVGV